MKSDLSLPFAPPRSLLWLILLVACMLRIAAAALVPDQTAAVVDSATYRAIGHQLWQNGTFTNPYFMPLYPALIGALGPGWTQKLADIAISTVMVWLVFELGLAIFRDRAIALVAAFGAAVYPP